MMLRTLLFIFLAGLLACQAVDKSESRNPETAPRDRLSEKYEPEEEFFHQRAYPNEKIDWTAVMQTKRNLPLRPALRGIGFEAEWTTQGPGNIGARVNTLAAHPSDNNTLFAGFSRGGVWRTTDGTATWQPIFDDQPFLAIGDIEIAPSNPDVIYVGTGDVNISGFPSVGDGLYRSDDGGDTWTNVGLGETSVIAKIQIHPTDPDHVVVATMGKHWQPDQERGVYRTTDGGANWEQILFIAEDAGAIDVIMSPDNPDLLLAAGWNRTRTQFTSIVEGDDAKIFRSTDGGDTWEMVTSGLPQDEQGRIGLTWSPTTPERAYAIYVGTDRQLQNIYRSDDNGVNWTAQVDMDDPFNGLTGNELGGFGWYFGKMRVVDQGGDDVLMLMGVDIKARFAGADDFIEVAPPWFTYEVHADKHDLIQLPDGRLYLATDGGIYRSDANFDFWEDVENIPTTQFYRIAHNPHDPNGYYGGAQDNGSTGGNAQNINDWPRIFGGDGFQMAFDPTNPDQFLVETQRGRIHATQDGGQNFATITDQLPFDEPRNWDMPYIVSPHTNTTIITGTDRLYRSELGSMGFEFVAQVDFPMTDTTQDSQLDQTISAVDESPLTPLRHYAGTSDGKVWRVDNSGTIPEVTEITAGLPNRYVTALEASPTFDQTVYVTHSGYRAGDYLPRIHRSDDRGDTWIDISANLPDLPINDVYVLPEHQDTILFVATDGGVYGTLDAGQNWDRLGVNMPNITVYDLDLNPARNELVAGTFARSIMTYPIDSLLAEPPVTVSTNEPSNFRPLTVKTYPNPATDALTVEFSNHEPGRAADLVVLDAAGRLIHRELIDGNGQQIRTLDVSDWSSGIYTVKVKTRHTVRTGRFQKL